MMDAEEIRRLQDAWTGDWHGDGEPRVSFGSAVGFAAGGGLAELAMKNHRANFDLWHEEDKARNPDASEAQVARVKRAIDVLNQRRNDVVEVMDEMLFAEAAGALIPQREVPLHSETPGMMIDRMSILSLKIFHTREQAERGDASESHRLRNADRLRILEEQREDLAGCLAQLWSEVLGGRRRFRIYRQMKMYNDPELNPAIYGSRDRAP